MTRIFPKNYSSTPIGAASIKRRLALAEYAEWEHVLIYTTYMRFSKLLTYLQENQLGVT